MRIIVAGCGFVGEPLRRRLLAAGHEVTGLTLSGGDGSTACDVSDPRSVQALPGAVGAVDAIVHCASSGRAGDRARRYREVYLAGCENLLAAFPTARLVFTSSTSVYPQTDGTLVTEDSPAEPDNETSQILRDAEDLTLAAGGTVARLAGIYGPGRSFLLKRFLEGAAQIEGRWINQIHRDDAGSALELLATMEGVRGIYNVADDRPLWQQDCFEELSRRFGLPVPPEGEPDPGRKRGWSNKRVGNQRLRDLGWAARFPCYFDALDKDEHLVPSILAQIGEA